jgi:hypothetical protein
MMVAGGAFVNPRTTSRAGDNVGCDKSRAQKKAGLIGARLEVLAT